MIFVPELTQHLTVIEATNCEAGGLPVVLVNGVPFVVAEVSKPVARVFDSGSKSARMTGRNSDTEAAQTTPVSIPLNESAESRNP